jgi:hypothetical protein
MSMKNLVLVASLSAAAAGCTESLSPLQVGAARPLDNTCSADTGSQRYAGSLDIALNAPYVIAFDVSSDLSTDDVTVGGDTVVSGTRNDFVVKEISFTYTSEPAGTFVPERIPAHAVIRAGDDEVMNISLIGPKAYATVANLLGAHESVTLMATFRLRGRLAGGQDAETNEVSYPITVYNSGFVACPAGTVLQNTGPCENRPGQDQAIIDPAIVCEAPGGNGGNP